MCREGLPELTKPGFTRLDKLKRDYRLYEFVSSVNLKTIVFLNTLAPLPIVLDQSLMLGEIDKFLEEKNPTLEPVQELAKDFLVRLKNLASEVSLFSGYYVLNNPV